MGVRRDRRETGFGLHLIDFLRRISPVLLWHCASFGASPRSVEVERIADIAGDFVLMEFEMKQWAGSVSV